MHEKLVFGVARKAGKNLRLAKLNNFINMLIKTTLKKLTLHRIGIQKYHHLVLYDRTDRKPNS